MTMTLTIARRIELFELCRLHRLELYRLRCFMRYRERRLVARLIQRLIHSTFPPPRTP